jgi:hypothetical protein
MRLLASAVVALIAALALALALPANAATRVGTDPDTRVRFKLSGRVLTVTVPTRATGVLRKLRGKRMYACGRSEPGSLEAAEVTHREAAWPRGRRSFRLRLPLDVSATANFCVIETLGGGDVASARMRAA